MFLPLYCVSFALPLLITPLSFSCLYVLAIVLCVFRFTASDYPFKDYRVDTVNYIGENNPKSKLEIHQVINSMDLVDVWRDKNPGVRRYTWRGPNKKQSRLDYFRDVMFATISV